MANSAADARGSELEIRKKLIKCGIVDVVISVAPNFFFTVTLPVTLWFFDKQKSTSKHQGEVLFIDARKIYTQIDRAHREFSAQQIEFISNIVKLYRSEEVESSRCNSAMVNQHFPERKYIDIKGLCKVANLKQIEDQRWSLNPGRYVDVAKRTLEDFDFSEELRINYEKLDNLNIEAHKLENSIIENIQKLLE